MLNENCLVDRITKIAKIGAVIVVSLFLAMGLISGGFRLLQVAKGYSGTSVYIDPPETNMYGPATQVGDTFSVSVVVANITNLQGYEYGLYWNNALLEISSIQDYNIWGGGPPFIGWNDTYPYFNSTHGCAVIVMVTLGGAVSGTFVLRDITFRILDAPTNYPGAELSSEIVLGVLPGGGEGPWFGDPEANIIPCEVHNGLFSYIWEPPLSATVDIRPDTLNLKGNGTYVTGYVELPEGYNVVSIDPASVSLEIPGWMESGNLLTNGGFESGLVGWDYVYGGGGSHAHWVTSDGAVPDVLYYVRWNSWADGGLVHVGQYLNILVSDYQEIRIELDVKVISNSLTDSGWWSYYNGGYGEFPGRVVVEYQDANGVTWDWDHHFFPSDNGEYWGRTNFEYVPRNTWVHYVSPNLVDVHTTRTDPYNVPVSSPTPYKITSIWVGGTGWDFSGMYDNVSLPYTRVTTLPVPAVSGKSAVGDYDLDGVADLMVKFDCATVQNYILKVIDINELHANGYATMTLTITGQLYDGTWFQGSDTITIIMPPPGRSHFPV